MASPNYIITINGVTTQVVLSASGIVDTNGRIFTALPSDAAIAANGDIIQHSFRIGKMTAISADSQIDDSTITTPSVTSGSAATSLPDPTTITATGSVTPAASPAAGNPAASTTNRAGHLFAGTRNIEDGGARVPDSPTDPTSPNTPTTPTNPNADPKIDPTPPSTTPPGGGGTTTPPSTPTSETPSPTTPAPGPWGTGNPQHEKAPEGTYDDASKLGGIADSSGIVSKISTAVGLIGIAAKILNKWGPLAGKLGMVAKFAGFAGVLIGGWGVFTSALSMFRDGKWDWGEFGNLAMSAAGIFGGLIAMGVAAGPAGWIALGIVGAAIAVAWLVNKLKPKEDNETDPSKGDVQGNTNTTAPTPPSWAQLLPVQSVYMILAGITAIGIGLGFNPIDLTSNGPLIRQEIIPPSQVPTFNTSFTKTLQKATNTTINGSLLGKVFIKAGVDGVPDKVVYVTQFTKDDGSDGGEAVNMVALNPGGVLVSPVAPKDQNMLMPFYTTTQDGKIKPNPKAFNSLGTSNAMLQVPNNGASPVGAATAVNMAALMGHMALETPTPTTGK